MTSPIAGAHIFLYTRYPLTQKAISFSPAISSAHSAINAHHTRLVKLFSFNLVCAKIILCKSENLLDEKSELQYFHVP